jgi:DNA-directed RNA polymerase subunit RPC12/RpoP
MGLISSSRTKKLFAVPLDTYGSLKDLTNQQIKLKEGMALVIYTDSAENEDLEADCVAYYDSLHKLWMAEIKGEIRYVPTHTDLWNQKEFLCLQCRKDLEPYFKEHGRNLETCCPNCGLSIFTSTLAP